MDNKLPPKWLVTLIILALAFTLISVPIYFLNLIDDKLKEMVINHASAMLGIPWAGGAAFIVVLVFKPVFGDIKFQVAGVNFEGASGPVVMWVFCFMAEIIAIKMLW
jgi:hypothetical protein